MSLASKIGSTVKGGMDGGFAKGGPVNPLSDIVQVPPPLPSPPPSPPPPFPPPPKPPPRPPFAPLGPEVVNTVFQSLNGGYNDGGTANPMRDLVKLPPPSAPSWETQSVRGFAEASVSGAAEGLGSAAGTAFLIVAVVGVVMALVAMVRGKRRHPVFLAQHKYETLPLVNPDGDVDCEHGEIEDRMRPGAVDSYGTIDQDNDL